MTYPREPAFRRAADEKDEKRKGHVAAGRGAVLFAKAKRRESLSAAMMRKWGVAL